MRLGPLPLLHLQKGVVTFLCVVTQLFRQWEVKEDPLDEMSTGAEDDVNGADKDMEHIDGDGEEVEDSKVTAKYGLFYARKRKK